MRMRVRYVLFGIINIGGIDTLNPGSPQIIQNRQHLLPGGPYTKYSMNKCSMRGIRGYPVLGGYTYAFARKGFGAGMEAGVSVRCVSVIKCSNDADFCTRGVKGSKSQR